jgi:sirohydrochlorin cobaltochelatase
MTTPNISRMLVLLAHGSNDARWKQPFETLLARLTDMPVRLAYMEMTTPRLGEVLADIVATMPQVTQIDVLPLFMASGGHLRHDVPQQLADMQAHYPGLTLTMLPPVGEHPLVMAAMQQVCTDWHAQTPKPGV